MSIIDMSLKNNSLYEGCEIKKVGEILTLITPVAEAVNIVTRNAATIVAAIKNRKEVTLTGSAKWNYLLVFNAVVQAFSKVWYHDGRTQPVLISQH